MWTAICTFTLLLGCGLVFKSAITNTEIAIVYFAAGILFFVAAVTGLIVISVINLIGLS